MAKKQKKAPKKEKPKAKPKSAPSKDTAPESEDFRGIVRIAGQDIKGQVKLGRALTRVKGVSHTLAVSASAAIKKELNIDPKTRIGELSEEQVEKIDKMLYSLQDHGVSGYLLNRRNDFRTGNDRHVIMNDLIFEISQDIDRDKKMYSWRGYRHTFGQKVRGQKTRNTGRSGMAVGVLRKAVIAAQGGAKGGPAKAAAGKSEKK